MRSGLSVEEMAQALTAIDAETMTSLNLREFDDIKPDYKSPTVYAATKKNQNLTDYIISDILRTDENDNKDVNEAVQSIAYWIDVAHLLAFDSADRNYNSAQAVLNAIEKIQVARIIIRLDERNIPNLSKDSHKKLDNLKILFNPVDPDRKNYKKALKIAREEQSASELRTLIPFLGLVQKEATFITDGNPHDFNGRMDDYLRELRHDIYLLHEMGMASVNDKLNKAIDGTKADDDAYYARLETLIPKVGDIEGKVKTPDTFKPPKNKLELKHDEMLSNIVSRFNEVHSKFMGLYKGWDKEYKFQDGYDDKSKNFLVSTDYKLIEAYLEMQYLKIEYDRLLAMYGELSKSDRVKFGKILDKVETKKMNELFFDIADQGNLLALALQVKHATIYCENALKNLIEEKGKNDTASTDKTKIALDAATRHCEKAFMKYHEKKEECEATIKKLRKSNENNGDVQQKADITKQLDGIEQLLKKPEMSSLEKAYSEVNIKQTADTKKQTSSETSSLSTSSFEEKNLPPPATPKAFDEGRKLSVSSGITSSSRQELIGSRKPGISTSAPVENQQSKRPVNVSGGPERKVFRVDPLIGGSRHGSVAEEKNDEAEVRAAQAMQRQRQASSADKPSISSSSPPARKPPDPPQPNRPINVSSGPVKSAPVGEPPPPRDTASIINRIQQSGGVKLPSPNADPRAGMRKLAEAGEQKTGSPQKMKPPAQNTGTYYNADATEQADVTQKERVVADPLAQRWKGAPTTTGPKSDDNKNKPGSGS